jgi:mono/diheme cytochrome c family protein
MTMTPFRGGRLFFFLGVTLCLSLTVSVQTKAEDPADQKNPFAGNAEAIAFGKTIYEATCTGYCHTTAASNRAGRCPNLFDCEWKHGGSDGQIHHTINEGVPNTEMVGFKGRLPDEMLWKITAYIRSASKCQDGQTATPAH